MIKRNSISSQIVHLQNLFNDILPNTVTGLFLRVLDSFMAAID